MTDHRDSFNMRVPKPGSPATEERGAFADPMKEVSFTGERNASGSASDMKWSDVPQGRDYARDQTQDGKGSPGPRFGKTPYAKDRPSTVG